MMTRPSCAVGLACLLAGCVADEGDTNTASSAPSCYNHGPLDYAPILVKLTVTANYDLKDPQGFYGYENSYMFDELDDINPGKYKLADGVIPNLILNVTITNDGYDHYGAYLEGHGNGEGYLFSYTWAQNYVTGSRLRADIAEQVNAFITQGWHRGNCG